MRKYDILVQSLHPSYERHTTKWERGVEATGLVEACNIAVARNPSLGITPTTVSMCWEVYNAR